MVTLTEHHRVLYRDAHGDGTHETGIYLKDGVWYTEVGNGVVLDPRTSHLDKNVLEVRYPPPFYPMKGQPCDPKHDKDYTPGTVVLVNGSNTYRSRYFTKQSDGTWDVHFLDNGTHYSNGALQWVNSVETATLEVIG